VSLVVVAPGEVPLLDEVEQVLSRQIR